jgi:hypothetical protein
MGKGGRGREKEKRFRKLVEKGGRKANGIDFTSRHSASSSGDRSYRAMNVCNAS